MVVRAPVPGKLTILIDGCPARAWHTRSLRNESERVPFRARLRGHNSRQELVISAPGNDNTPTILYVKQLSYRTTCTRMDTANSFPLFFLEKMIRASDMNESRELPRVTLLSIIQLTRINRRGGS